MERGTLILNGVSRLERMKYVNNPDTVGPTNVNKNPCVRLDEDNDSKEIIFDFNAVLFL